MIPNLKVDGMALGPKAAGIDLKFLLYKGGASLDARWGQKDLASGKLGRPLHKRLPLLQAIHRRWQTAVQDKTLSDASILGEWSVLKLFVAFADSLDAPLTVENAARRYLQWAGHIERRDDLKPGTRYDYSITLARAIAPALGIDAKRLQWKTKIRMPKAFGSQGAKESLEATSAFIQLMLETIDHLSIDAIYGPLPVVLRYGEAEYQIDCGTSRWKPLGSLKTTARSHRKKAGERRIRASQDVSNAKRAMLINLRLDAELLVFINQTSCNLTQALQLTGGKFRYQSDGDYVRVLPWKRRAKHAVELRIEKGYRPRFESFLKWREAIFPGDPDGLTFPFVYGDGERAMQRTAWNFKDARRLCTALGRPFVNSMQHRKTIGNFVRRRASRQMAAELLSNNEKTFQNHYEAPDHQRAAAELVHFWDAIEAMVGASIGPGGCHDAEPAPLPGAPDAAPRPDCEGEAGCLFCSKNRDLRSFDHAWNLASFHQLKLLEFNADRTGLSQRDDNPVLITVERAAAKLDAMEREDDECAAWVAEARLRVLEGLVHPHYASRFETVEGAA